MFEFVRTHKRLFQFVLVLLIFPSFALWGVQGYSSYMDPSQEAVATFAGGEITQAELEAAHRQNIERYRQQVPGLDTALLDTPQMRQQTLDGLVRERVLARAAEKDHLSVSDAQLAARFRSDPQYAFLRNPDGSVNKEVLAAQGMTSEMFAERLRREYALAQVTQPVTGFGIVGKTVAQQAADALLQRREIEVQRFPTGALMDGIKPTDAQIEAYYKAHEARYRSPESANIEYVVLDLPALEAQVQVPEAELKAYYEQNRSRYEKPEERRASHILLTVDAKADDATRKAVRAKAEGLLAQAKKNPAGFAELARQHSQDPGSKDKGGDLDFFGRGAMVKPFEDAVFAMKPGQISEVVKSDFGYHIIKLTEVRGGSTQTFDEVKADIQKDVVRQEAQKRYAEAAEQFTNLVFEQADTLQPVIDKLHLSKQTATVQRQAAPGAQGPLASPKLLEAVFANDALTKKQNTPAVETAANQLVSARVTEYHPAKQLALAEVRDAVVQAVQMDEARKRAREAADKAVAAVKASPSHALGDKRTISRTQAADTAPQIVEAALRADLSKGPTAVVVDLGPQGFAAVKIDGIVARPTDDPDNERAGPFVAQALSQAETEAFTQALKTRFDVKYKGAYAPGAAAAAAASAASAAASASAASPGASR